MDESIRLRSQLHQGKVRAYLANNFRLGHTEYSVILKIGMRSGRLAALFKSSGAASEEGAE